MIENNEVETQSALSKALNAFDGLKKREQKLLLIAIPSTLLFVLYFLVIEPLVLEKQKLEKDLTRSQNQLDNALKSVDELVAQALVDPNETINKQIGSLQGQLKKLDNEFSSELDQLVLPKTMPILLEQLFVNTKSLSLISMNSIAPEELFADLQSEMQTNKIYRHGIEIKFQGGYFETRDFLAAVEKLGWKLYWHSLEYKVVEYPLAETHISLFTLSTSEAFLGVE